MAVVGICGTFLLGTAAARTYDAHAAKRRIERGQIALALAAVLMIASQWL